MTGQSDPGIATINQAIRLSPHDGFMPMWLLSLFWAYYAERRYDEAAKVAQRGIRIAPDNPTLRRQLAAAYAMLDRKEEARAAMGEYLRLEPNHTIADSSASSQRRAKRLAQANMDQAKGSLSSAVTAISAVRSIFSKDCSGESLQR